MQTAKEDPEQIAAMSKRLASDVIRWTDPAAPETDTAISGLSFYRQDKPTACSVCVVEPSIALVVQGAKSMMLEDTTFRYDPNSFLITSLDLPAKMQVLEASPEKPYLGVVIKLDLATVSDLLSHVPLPKLSAASSGRGMNLSPASPDLYDAIQRLVSLLDEPNSIPVLAPLIKKEIYWRILIADQGARLRQIVSAGSQGLRISRSVEWLKSHYDQPLRVDELAENARMSRSTFHHHFRDATSMSPLQYQKRLRLTEARRLMLAGDHDATAAAYKVGYESPSQFSREYARLFGAPPRRDIEEHLQSGHI